MTELDSTARQAVSRLAAISETRKQLDDEEKALKATLRQTLGLGVGTVGGAPVVSISPNRRFNATRAAEVLPPELVALCSSTVVDSKKAKATLPPGLYEQCMAEVGDPVVRIS